MGQTKEDFSFVNSLSSSSFFFLALYASYQASRTSFLLNSESLVASLHVLTVRQRSRDRERRRSRREKKRKRTHSTTSCGNCSMMVRSFFCRPTIPFRSANISSSGPLFPCPRRLSLACYSAFDAEDEDKVLIIFHSPNFDQQTA